MLLALGIASGVIFRFGASSFTFFYDHWIGFVTASFVMSFTQACYCYATSFLDGNVTALGGNTGNVLYDVGCFATSSTCITHTNDVYSGSSDVN
jgi:delta14-sterol reductase